MPAAAAEPRDPLRTAAIVLTVLLHVGVFGGMYLSRALSLHHPAANKETFVDAQLVRFGKPRDLSFLPHKEGVVHNKAPLEAIKVARDEKALPRLDKDQKPDEVDPLKKTHAELFKNLQDRPEGVENREGSLTGSHAGTSNEAKGDPYILQLVDQIGTAWSIPTTIKESDLANLTADVCLTISESGALSSYRLVRSSGNSQFDSSLDATLSTIKHLPPPPDRDIQTPSGPRNLRSLATRGRLCPTLSK